jgi:hypothetical protein
VSTLCIPSSERGESGEVTVENGKFTIQIPFMTQSRAPVLIGSLLEKCGRKPKTVRSDAPGTLARLARIDPQLLRPVFSGGFALLPH